VRFAFHADTLAVTQTAGNGTTLELVSRVAGLDSSWGVPATQTSAGALNYLGQMVAAQAQSQAYADGFALVAIVFWVGILPALWMRAKH
jgi:hypothetical protein